MELHQPYETLTRWQIKRARKHAKLQRPGTPVEKPFRHRVRLSLPKVDHFIDFINRPYFYQVVAYGTRVIKLDNGEEMMMPNVVRTVTRSTMITQYHHFCEEEGFVPLSRLTLFKILDVREASQRKSLQGLDNAAADGTACWFLYARENCWRATTGWCRVRLVFNESQTAERQQALRQDKLPFARQ